MDCKKALQHEGVDGNMDKAVEVLRKQGMKRVNKVSSRTTSQGAIAMKVDETNNHTGEPQEVLFSGDNIETDEHQCGFSRDDVKRRFKAIIMSISLYKWRVC